MRNTTTLCMLLFGLILVLGAGGAHAQTSLDGLLTPYLEKYDLPALAAAVVHDGKVIAVGAVGTRRTGHKIPVTVNDRFHLGSDTKAMTALLASMLVEEGKLRWDATPAAILPELAGKMGPDFKNITLTQLLSHTSGIPGDNHAFVEIMGKSLLQEGDLDKLRLWIIGEFAGLPLAAKPGETFAYSNMNYIIAGAMVERMGGKTWEELITERIFVPLELKTAGLGPQASLGKIDAPLGHQYRDKKQVALLPGPSSDNPAVIGPAGTAHMSVLDFANWAGWNAGRGKRGPKLATGDTLTKLQTPVIEMPVKIDAPAGTPSRGGYGLGWGQMKVDWASEPLVFHGGSNGYNLAHAWLDPKQDVAMVLLTNVSGPQADKALGELAQVLYTKFGPKK